ncbi:signal peptidase I [Alkaliphilus sp. B6464]|uniref:signal peptidase I n=1 Tax=Alkaliphilus sp. B6464 TaxID=2731219 RepID=UPI001BA7028E|nr:signal peptidase I [Alkaliphilus sp. B6464]QUH21969.1 signal peptidase I [Alkaliphilus sp. B6464]
MKDNVFEVANHKNEQYKWINKKEIFEWIRLTLLALSIVFLLNNYFIVNASVPTGSMIGTIMPNDRVIASRMSYFISTPQRGDVVIFKYPDDEKILFVKRIIGLPNDEIYINNGKVYINEEVIDEPYVNEIIQGEFGPYKVPINKYFMLGDNRNDSQDSRFWKNKYVSRSDILGKATFKYYPKFKLIK